jgi:Tol biopolymer transport system component
MSVFAALLLFTATSMVQVQDVSWSPDGRKLYFSAMRVKPDYSDYRPEKWDVYQYVLATGRLTPIAATSFTVAASPKGRRIAVGKLAGGNRDIYLFDEGGRELARLTSDPAEDSWPAWSPDGKWIAFNSKRDGRWEIYVIKADGTAERRLTRHESQRSLSPSWSPDGRRIVFYVEKGDGKDQINVMNADGSGVTAVTNDAFNNIFPVWISKTRIVYGQGKQIVAVDADGSNMTSLGIESHYARYSPDGSKIAYATRDAVVILRKDGTLLKSITLEEVAP